MRHAARIMQREADPHFFPSPCGRGKKEGFCAGRRVRIDPERRLPPNRTLRALLRADPSPFPLPQGEGNISCGLRKMREPDARSSGESGFGLYVHWPFCLSKCPYCDFNSHVRAAVDHGRWRQALLRELDHYAADTRGRGLTSIFFGGTPSLMEPATVAAVIERAAGHWPFAADIEITLEANPTSVEAGKFAGF